MKLVRTGNAITAYRSKYGSTWTTIGTVSLPPATDLLVGLAVTSHDNSNTCTAGIDSVTVTSRAAHGDFHADSDANAHLDRDGPAGDGDRYPHADPDAHANASRNVYSSSRSGSGRDGVRPGKALPDSDGHSRADRVFPGGDVRSALRPRD
jgi:hypothetical protein